MIRHIEQTRGDGASTALRGAARYKRQVTQKTRMWRETRASILSTKPRPRAHPGSMYNLLPKVARVAPAAHRGPDRVAGAPSAFVLLKREEAEQADRPSRGPKGAPQELGCLPDLTAQNNNEKTGQRIHDFELSIDYSSRELGLSRTRIASTARSKKREHEWMRCRRNFSHLSEGIVDEERRIKPNSSSVFTRQSPTRAGRGERPRDKSSP